MKNETTIRKRTRKRFPRSERKEHICSAIPILSRSRVPRKIRTLYRQTFPGLGEYTLESERKAAKNAKCRDLKYRCGRIKQMGYTQTVGSHQRLGWFSKNIELLAAPKGHGTPILGVR